MMKWIQDQRFLSFLVLGVCSLIALLLILSKKDVQKVEREIKPTLVEVLLADKRDEYLVFNVYGTVQPNRELTLHPEVSGKVIEQSKNLVIGGLIKKDEILLKIDPRDYVTALEVAKAAVEKAKFELQREKGRQIVAEREWELLDPTIISTEIGEELARRKPHLREKEAALKAADSRMEKANVDLERTIIRSPFDALVIKETIEPGELVTQQSTIATLVATDEFRVQVSIPFNQLQWIDLPTNGDQGSQVTILQTLGEGRELQWKAHILRLLGDVDPKSRMARLLVGIGDPMGIYGDKANPPLLIGTYVRVEIQGPKVRDVIVLPREVIHNENEVWVKSEEGLLEIRKVKIVFKDQESVFVKDGIEEGDEIVVSSIPIPIPGMKLIVSAELKS